MIFTIFLSHLVFSVGSQSDILKHVEELYQCEPGCWFREPEISSATIEKWPKNCTEVCGAMWFKENSTIPVFDMIPYFEKMRTFKGFIDFSYSKYASLDFLSNLETIFCDGDMNIIGNSNLEQLNFDSLSNITCDFSIVDNPRLDLSSFCEKFEGLVILNTRNNLKNCAGCQAYNFYYDEFEQFRECTLVTFGLSFRSFTIMEMDPVPDLSAFGKIQNVTRGFEVYQTDLFDLKFLKSLENIKGTPYTGYFDYDINIQSSRNLTRFGIPNLKQLIPRVPNFRINVQAVHNDFCFTTSEFKFFLDQKVVFANLEAKICENDTTACIFKTMKNLEQNCSEILGKIKIASGDEVYTEKLKNVKNIWGSLTISNTTLTDLNFLGNLEYVALLNDSSIPVQVISNKMLKKVKIPSLKRVFSKSVYQISFQNSGDGFLNSTGCLDLIENVFETYVVFDGRQCEVIDRIKNYHYVEAWLWGALSLTGILYFLVF